MVNRSEYTTNIDEKKHPGKAWTISRMQVCACFYLLSPRLLRFVYLYYDLNPPGCGALFLLRAAGRPCKKQTAFLLRLADFCFAPRRALAKTGALRQTQLPVSSAGRGRCVCPCSASPVSAAGSGSAAQPPAHSGAPAACSRAPIRGLAAYSGSFFFNFAGTVRHETGAAAVQPAPRRSSWRRISPRRGDAAQRQGGHI